MAKKEDTITLHRKLASALKSFRGEVAIPIQDIAKKMGSDPRTVKHHLAVMAMYHQIVFLDSAKSIVATLPALEKLVQRVREEQNEIDELVYASAASGASIAWRDE